MVGDNPSEASITGDMLTRLSAIKRLTNLMIGE